MELWGDKDVILAITNLPNINDSDNNLHAFVWGFYGRSVLSKLF